MFCDFIKPKIAPIFLFPNYTDTQDQWFRFDKKPFKLS